MKSDNRSARASLAEQTLGVLEAGAYVTAGGRRVDIFASLRRCIDGTRLYLPDEIAALVAAAGEPAAPAGLRITLRNETTLEGVRRLAAERTDDDLALLNFASARNPGGGFLGGSQAQEESLARSTGLYASLVRMAPFYDFHRAQQGALYSDRVIWSPGCPVFRDDTGRLLDEPHAAHVLTCAAPNAGAVASNSPQDLPGIPVVLRRRAEGILAVARAQGARRLVLGAWGCGVFRNDPVAVAQMFAGLLADARWSAAFEHVHFSVLDASPGHATWRAFERSFGPQAAAC